MDRLRSKLRLMMDEREKNNGADYGDRKPNGERVIYDRSGKGNHIFIDLVAKQLDIAQYIQNLRDAGYQIKEED